MRPRPHPAGGTCTRAAGADRLDIQTISELREHPGLAFAFSNEFMDRPDGWPGLRARYDLPQQSVRGMDHDLSYRALAAGSVDLTDLYGEPEAVVANRFVQDEFGFASAALLQDAAAARIWRHTKEHLARVAISLFAAILVAIPLGIAAPSTTASTRSSSGS